MPTTPIPSYSQYINKYVSPNNTEYWLRDEEARELISALEKSTQWLGVTTTALSDGLDWLDRTTTPYSVKPIVINGDNVTPMNGSIAQYSNGEFILTVTLDESDPPAPTSAVWQEFGNLSSLGLLAFKDNVTGSTTFTPRGTVTQPTFTGNKAKFTATASGTAVTVTKGTLAGSLASAPTISVKTAGTTDTIQGVASQQQVVKTVVAVAPAQSAPSNPITYMDVTNHKLRAYQIGYTLDNAVTTTTTKTFKTGDASYTASAPSVNISGAPSVSAVTQPTVSIKVASASSSETGDNIYQPSGTISQPSFNGTQDTISITST